LRARFAYLAERLPDRFERYEGDLALERSPKRMREAPDDPGVDPALSGCLTYATEKEQLSPKAVIRLGRASDDPEVPADLAVTVADAPDPRPRRCAAGPRMSAPRREKPLVVWLGSYVKSE